jgi:predicted nucleic-acid-binding Zn-ribbon protein
MKHGCCPRCQSTKIYRASSSEGDGLSAASYPAQIEISGVQGPATLWIDTFICQDCGYMELFVANRDELCKLSQADGWVKVEPGKADLAQ